MTILKNLHLRIFQSENVILFYGLNLERLIVFFC